MAKYYDISKWNKQVHLHTSGTRDKFIAISPVDEVLERIKTNYSKQKLEEIVLNIDNQVPEKFKDYKIPEERKIFLIKYIDLRIQKLMKLYEKVL